jgi:hypothetical protein
LLAEAGVAIHVRLARKIEISQNLGCFFSGKQLGSFLDGPGSLSESEHFAAAVSEMPPKVRAFFEREESPYIPPHRRESAEEREGRLLRESIGGWCG